MNYLTESPYSRTQLTCIICGYLGDSETDFILHGETHRHDGVFSCEQCQEMCNDFKVHTQHITSHKLKKLHICLTCGRVFDYPNLLKDHSNLHTGKYTLSEACSGVTWADLMAAQFTPLQASDRV